jgi:hypothetical protein
VALVTAAPRPDSTCLRRPRAASALPPTARRRGRTFLGVALGVALGVSPRFRTRGLVAAAAAALVLTAVTGCGARVAGQAVEAAGGTASPSPTAGGSSPGTTKPGSSASPSKPALVPTDAEALSLVNTLDVSPTNTAGELDEAEAAKRLAEPMLSVVKASWRIAKPSYRISGRMPAPFQGRVYRPAPSANGDRWFVVADGTLDSDDSYAYIFRSTAADPTWKLAMATILVEGQRFPGIDEDKAGLAQVVSSSAGLAVDPAAVCVQFAKPAEQRPAWGPNMRKLDEMIADDRAQLERQKVTKDGTSKLRADAVGPVWRSADGGALVPCVMENRQKTAVSGGGALLLDGSSRYKVDVPGLKVASYVDTNITMALVWVPPATGAASTVPDVATVVTFPLDFTYVEAKR